MKNKFPILSFTLVLLLLCSTSCHKDLDQAPKYGLNAEVVYSNPDNYINVLAKLYAGLAVTGIDGPAGNADIQGIDEGFSAYVRVLFNLQELPTDAAVCGWNDPGIPEMNKMQWSPDNSFVKAMYARIFYQVTICNEFIREASDEKMTERGFTDAQQTTIRTYRNEARFLRALSYYHALDLFGNVPFVTEEDKVGAFLPPRKTRAELFSYIETELKDIETKLGNAGTAPYGRADQGAVNFLLARLYLNAVVYTGTDRYADCALYASKVINSGVYSLDNNYQDLFLADNHTSPEIIFPVCFDGLFTKTYGGTTFLVHAAVGGTMSPSSYGIAGGWQGLRTTRPFVETFTDSTLDSRYLFYKPGQSLDITNLGTFTQGYGLPKYKNVTSTGQPGSNVSGGFVDIDFPMFRLADAYLMYAEAAIRGGGSVSQGLQYMNLIRQRAYGNSNFDFTSITLDDVLKERGKELQWECIRRTDLIRYGLFTGGTYVWPFKGGAATGTATSSHLDLYPIPTNDIVLNPNLIQNPGY